MATQNILYTFGLKDAKGKPATVPVYGTFDDSTATLAQLMAYASTTLLKLDPITEAVPTYVAVTLYPSLPGSGIKTVAVAGSDVEESGLIGYQLTTPANRSYAQDIPAFLQSLYVRGHFDNTGDVDAWTAQMLNHATVVVPTNDFFASTLNAFLKGDKSFRQFGRKAKRY